MFRNYLKTALRSLRKEKGYASINVAGLAIALACTFFIVLWVQDELAHDRFFADGDRIFRVWRSVDIDGEIHTLAPTPRPLADVLRSEIPDIEAVSHMSWEQQMIVSYDDRSFREEANYAGADFFRVFPFPFIAGNASTALAGETSLVITDRLARRLFGTDWRTQTDVLGRPLVIDREREYAVSAVIDDIPSNSSIQFDVLLPIEDYFRRNTWTQFWTANSFPLYVRLKDESAVEAVNDRIAGLIEAHRERARETLFLQSFEDLYLYSDYRDGRLVGGRIEYVRVFSFVAVFLLLIAAINFMNLATARSGKRAREIGVRKAIGATRGSLVIQFLAESLLMAGIASVLAAGLVALLLPAFSSLTGKHVTLGDLQGRFILAALALAVVVGFVSGSYPALFLSRFEPLVVLRGAFVRRSGSSILRKGLVVFQFALSVLLITGTVTVFRQIHHTRTQNLGLDHENVVSVPLEGPAKAQYETLERTLLAAPSIAGVSSSNMSPLQMGGATTDPVWEGKAADDDRLFYVMETNYGFVETMKMDLVSGRAFSKEFGADTANFVVNEEAARALGNGEAVGKALDVWGRRGRVIGVVKNFRMGSIYAPVQPTIFRLTPGGTNQLFVRTEAGRTHEALAALEAVYARFNAGYPFAYRFLDQEFEASYRAESVMGQLTNVFAGIAIFISCLGLLGLVSFTAEQRTKEIGVRKVMGASVPDIVMLLTGDFTKLVVLGIVIALPAAYVAADRWLGRFDTHIDLGPGMFLLAGLLAVSIAWLTVSYQSIKAALADPVRSLRSE